MDIINFLNKHQILWQPILLSNKIPFKFDNGILPAIDDYKNLSKEEIIKRQSNYKKSEYIAIYTNEIQQIDIDDPKAIEKYSFLKEAPYYKSIHKQLPHYFVKIDDFTKTRSDIIGGDILTGQWGYCKRNAKVINSESPLCSFKIENFDIKLIDTKQLNDLVEKLREEITPDTDYKTWSVIIQNIFNISCYHLFDNPNIFCHNFSKDSVKYNKAAITKINNLKINNYSAKSSLDYLKKMCKNNVKKIEENREKIQEILLDFYEINKGLIFYCGETLWMKDSIFVWRNNKSTIKEMVLQWLYLNHKNKINIDGMGSFVKYIIGMASHFCRDEQFENKFYTSTIGKLCFKNGVLDISTRKFDLWGTPETINVFTKVQNLYNYTICNPIIKQELMDRVFNPIFNNNQELIKEHLCCISRALYCHTDKYYSVWVGVRNSGKGVLTKLYTKALNAYVSTFDANNLIKKKGNNNETSKANGWKIPFCECRLVIGNEMTIDSKSCIDGNQLKQIASGGDEITTRVNYGFDTIHKVIGHLILFQNDFPDIHPTDTYQTMLYVDMPCAFQKEESDLAIRRDPDTNIKDFIQNEEVYLALVDLLLDNYGAPNYSLMISQAKGIKNEETDSEFIKVKSLFNITTNKDDNLTITEIDNILLNNDIKLTNVCRNRYFNKMGKTCKINNKKAYRFIKRKE